MKITRRQIRQIINEELSRTLVTKRPKKIGPRELRRLILREARSLLREHTIPDSNANINDMDAGAVWDIMVGETEGAEELISAIGSATAKTDGEGKVDPKWGPGALKDAGGGDAAGLKALAEKIWGADGKSKFVSNVASIVSALGASEGYAKPEMPAFEGGDGPAVADALSEPGEINIDIGADYGGDIDDFEEYLAYAEVAEEEGKEGEGEGEDEEEKNESRSRHDQLVLEKWNRMAGLVSLVELKSDERFPFVGPAAIMPGAPNLGDKGSIDIDAIKGVAKKFLTKGKGNKGDDVNVTMNQSLSNKAMKPTQTNVKAAKTLLFALLNSGEDMGGAFASSDGEIIDGHHRWSGQRLRTGGDVDHAGVHIIDKPSGMDTKEFLTMLTVLGTALGRPTKLK